MVAGGLGSKDSFGGYRTRLVEQLQAKGIKDLAVIRAVAQVPRHLFVPESVRHRAYEDSALPIGGGQTISQPWVQARSIELLRLQGHERVLEVGAGSGYQTALLACITSAVFAVERVPALAYAAREALARAGMANVTVLVGDGTLGWRSVAPFDAILVAAASPSIPKPLLEQLAPGGRMSIRVGAGEGQALTLIERDGDSYRESVITDVRFVPLLGKHGF
jgi:protein-L-isoaspartate(D-aspartate) O-methyltransferase